MTDRYKCISGLCVWNVEYKYYHSTALNSAVVPWGLCDPRHIWLTFFLNCHKYWHRLLRIFLRPFQQRHTHSLVFVSFRLFLIYVCFHLGTNGPHSTFHVSLQKKTIDEEIQATDVPNISETSGNICLWNVGAKRKHENQIKGIRKEGTKKNLRTYQRKWWHIAKSNEELNRLIGNKNIINYIKAKD